MKEKLKAHFLKIGSRNFVIITVLSLFVTDLVNSWFLKVFWQGKQMSMVLLQTVFTQKGVNIADFSQDSLREMMDFINNAFYFFIFIILINNLFFYLFYLRRKLWAQSYVLFYAITGALLQLSFVFENEAVGWGWTTYNLLIIPYYIYVFLGVKLLKAETTDAVPGRKAQ